MRSENSWPFECYDCHIVSIRFIKCEEITRKAETGVAIRIVPGRSKTFTEILKLIAAISNLKDEYLLESLQIPKNVWGNRLSIFCMMKTKGIMIFSCHVLAVEEGWFNGGRNGLNWETTNDQE
jgi:hypothetical protein